MAGHAPYRFVADTPREPPAPSTAICRHCGIVAPARGTACEVCSRPLAATRMQVLPPGDDTYWVAVRCGFTCNSCKFLAPLDSLDADGAVECAQCGLRQRFDLDGWPPALAFAHAIGDLAGPGPEGRSPHPALWIGSENPYSKIGDTHTFERLADAGGTVLGIDATPGAPVCRKCQLPLTVSVVGPGSIATSCGQCGERAAYTLPDSARNLDDTVVGVVAHEHRTDQPKARPMGSGAGAVALQCPACGAPLQLQGADRLQRCPFCSASCIVPARSLSQLRHETPMPEVWWILFRGPSKKRRELEAPVDAVVKDVKAALKLLKPGAGSAPIGDAPGVYEAPEAPGINWPQVLLTVTLGGIALAIGYLALGK